MPSPRIHEEFLRRLWLTHSRTTSGLTTTQGQPVSVLSPGQPNSDGGPDFTDAIIRIGTVVYAGDIEVHVRASSWHSHRHARDPHYNRVILHVALLDDVPDAPVSTKAGRAVPLLLLSPLLPPELIEVQAEPPGSLLKRAPLPCLNKAPFEDDAAVRTHLRRLGGERIAARIALLEERLRQLAEEREREEQSIRNHDEVVGASPGIWAEILYEGLFEAMGYGKNSRPFLELARNVRLDALRRFDLSDVVTVQCILFGAAGLLPSTSTLPEKQSRARVRVLRRRWKEVRPYFRVPLLQEGEWLFFRLRPANFPTARLAVCSHLLQRLFAPGAIDHIWSILRRTETVRPLPELQKLFLFEADEYWSRHLHFRQKQPGRGISLGVQRVREIVLNTIVPLGIVRGRAERDEELKAGAERLLGCLPAPLPNAVTRLVVEDLLGGKKLGSALEDQGALALVGGWCKAQRCRECPLIL